MTPIVPRHVPPHPQAARPCPRTHTIPTPAGAAGVTRRGAGRRHSRRAPDAPEAGDPVRGHRPPVESLRAQAFQRGKADRPA